MPSANNAEKRVRKGKAVDISGELKLVKVV